MNLKRNTIYVLHENGAPTHYAALDSWCDKINASIIYREFSIVTNFVKAMIKGQRKTMRKCLKNFWFILSLCFSTDKVIVLGAAPFNSNMVWLNFISKRHLVFYHTSWIYWDGLRVPHSHKISVLDRILRTSWRKFLEENCEGIFCVTRRAESQLNQYYDITCPTIVVGHSVNLEQMFSAKKVVINKPLKALFVGRIVKEKGIEELVYLANEKKLKDKILFGIIGPGDFLLEEIENLSEKNMGVTFYGKIPKNELGKIYQQYDILICPSKRTPESVWEELFGMVIIEGMSCGLIPLATNHYGPMEIIEDQVNGFLVEDNIHLPKSLLDKLLEISNLEQHRIIELANKSIERGLEFRVEIIEKKWAKLLYDYI